MPTGLALQFLTVLMQSHWVWAVSAVQLIGGLLVLLNRNTILGLMLLGPVIFNILVYHALLQPSMAPPALLVTILWFFLFYRTVGISHVSLWRAPTDAASKIYCGTSSLTTLKLSSRARPKLVVMAQSVASRPVAISTRPMRGIL